MGGPGSGRRSGSREWKPEEDTMIRAHWGRWTWRRFAAELRASRSAIFGRARELGVVRPRRWLPEHDAWLVSHASSGVAFCARKLSRTPRAVSRRLWSLGVDPDERTVDVTAEWVANVCGVDPSTVHRWVRAGKLKGFSTHAVRKFVMAYPECLRPSGESLQELMFLVAGEM